MTRDDVDVLATTLREWYPRNFSLITSRRKEFCSIPKH